MLVTKITKVEDLKPGYLYEVKYVEPDGTQVHKYRMTIARPPIHREDKGYWEVEICEPIDKKELYAMMTCNFTHRIKDASMIAFEIYPFPFFDIKHGCGNYYKPEYKFMTPETKRFSVPNDPLPVSYFDVEKLEAQGKSYLQVKAEEMEASSSGSGSSNYWEWTQVETLRVVKMIIFCIPPFMGWPEFAGVSGCVILYQLIMIFRWLWFGKDLKDHYKL